jgi:hypothetical protein
MSKHQEPMAACTAAGVALTSSEQSIPFEHRDFNTAELLQIFSCGKTTLFQDIIPHLEIYYEGPRIKATGRSIIKYRERKLAEPRRKHPAEHLPNVKKRRRSGSAP